MSERGSFVTEWMYCEKCRQAIANVLGDAIFRPYVLRHEERCTGARPVVCGNAGGSWAGEEFTMFEHSMTNEIASVICHPIRIAILSDDAGSRVYRIWPKDMRMDGVVFEVLCREDRTGYPARLEEKIPMRRPAI